MSTAVVVSFLDAAFLVGPSNPIAVSTVNPLPVTLGGAIAATVTQGPGNVANPWTVQGPVAGGVATSGNPLKAGAVFNSALPTYLTGQTGELQLSSRGMLSVSLLSQSGTVVTVASPSDGGAQVNGLGANAQSLIFNGATWDRFTKPRTAFRLPNSAATNNAANIKASPGTVFQISANITLAASVCYLKFFDGTGVPNPAAVNPLYIFALNIVNGMASFVLPTQGLYFPTGIGVAIVANSADLDNTAIAAGQITALNVGFA